MGAWKLASLFLIGLLWVEAGGIEVKEDYGDNKVRKTRQDPMGFGYSYNLYKPGVVASVTKEEISAPAPVISSLHSATALNSRSTLDQNNNYYDKFPPTNQLAFSDESQDLLGKYQDFQKYENKYNDDESEGFRGYRPFKAETDYSAADEEESQERPSYSSRTIQPFNRGRPDRFNKEIDEAFDDEGKFLKDVDNYDDYKSMSAVNYEGPHQIETIQSKSYHKKVPYLDISEFEHKSEQKHGEVHYHQHKHMHKHEHKQEHVHQHKQEHKHEHGHKHQHHQEHKHEHHQKHKHEHHQEHKHEHHQEHKHEHHHGHKHKQHHEHKHDHHQEHKHDHHHGHKHDHHQEHKHEHHQDHKHDHHHGHKHEHHQEHKHEHHQDHKHDHHHKHGHKHKHHQEHKHDHHQEHKHDHHHKHGHKHGHKHNHNHKHGHKHSHHKH